MNPSRRPPAHARIAEARPAFHQSCSGARGETRSSSRRPRGVGFSEVAKCRAAGRRQHKGRAPAGGEMSPAWPRGHLRHPPAASLGHADSEGRGGAKSAHVLRSTNTESEGDRAPGGHRLGQLRPRPSRLCPRPPASVAARSRGNAARLRRVRARWARARRDGRVGERKRASRRANQHRAANAYGTRALICTSN